MKHSGRELELMLTGKKAMSAFCHLASEKIDPTDGQDFKAAVSNNIIRRGRFFVNGYNGRKIIYSVYYRSGEEWRFNLFKYLKKSINDGWNIDKEIIESLLLDYDQNSLNDYLHLLEKRG